MIYRSELNRPMTWVELDDNFREVAKIPTQTASDVAASQKAVADAKLEVSKSQQASSDALASAERSEAAAKANADIVAACMAPFPDVWIPFSSNLRMIEGVGGDVKVGDVTVANLVNFERSTTATYIDKSGVLRTAAINEPRFEKKGLLIEGQSTNLLAKSETLTSGDLYLQSGNVLDEFTASNNNGFKRYKIRIRKGTANFAQFDLRTVVATMETNTSSAFVRVNNVAETRIKGRNLGAVITKSDDFVRVCHTESAGAVELIHYIGFRSTGDLDIDVYALQQEPFPFASSYIPTSGSAVTRAADRPKIGAANYANDNTRDITIHVTADTMQTPAQRAEYPRVVNCLSPANMFLAFGVYPDGRWNCYAGLGGGVTTPTGNKPEMPSTMGFVVKNGKARAFINGAFGSEVTTVAAPVGDIGFSSDSRPLWGHIRNFRIWHSALSDEQIKCLK